MPTSSWLARNIRIHQYTRLPVGGKSPSDYMPGHTRKGHNTGMNSTDTSNTDNSESPLLRGPDQSRANPNHRTSNHLHAIRALLRAIRHTPLRSNVLRHTTFHPRGLRCTTLRLRGLRYTLHYARRRPRGLRHALQRRP